MAADVPPMRYTREAIAAALRVFVTSGSANGNEEMRKHLLKFADTLAEQAVLIERKDILAARDLEWVKAIHDACSNVSPADPQGKPIDPADIKRCVDAHVRNQLGVSTATPQSRPEPKHPL